MNGLALISQRLSIAFCLPVKHGQGVYEPHSGIPLSMSRTSLPIPVLSYAKRIAPGVWFTSWQENTPNVTFTTSPISSILSSMSSGTIAGAHVSGGQGSRFKTQDGFDSPGSPNLILSPAQLAYYADDAKDVAKRLLYTAVCEKAQTPLAMFGRPDKYWDYFDSALELVDRDFTPPPEERVTNSKLRSVLSPYLGRPKRPTKMQIVQ
jgi:hypothetical protein